MARFPGIEATAATAPLRAAHGLRWSKCGWDGFRRDPTSWLGAAAWYLICATLLAQVPFAGMLIVVLVSPTILAGVLLTLNNGAVSASPIGRSRYERWVTRPTHPLTRAFANEAHAYPAILLGMVTLGTVVAVLIVQNLFGLGSWRALVYASKHGPVPAWSIAIGLLGAAILELLLVMSLLFAAHRTILAQRDPLTAMTESFGACLRHRLAAAVFAIPYVILYAALTGTFFVSRPFGYLLLYAAGVVALPVFVIGSFCAYQDIFGTTTDKPPIPDR